MCVTGCGTAVQRTGAHCPECRKRLRAARARARRGAAILPSLPGSDAAQILERIRVARDALDRLEATREHAERVRDLDGVPFTEVDLWIRAIRAELTLATDAFADWYVTAKDVQQHTRPQK